MKMVRKLNNTTGILIIEPKDHKHTHNSMRVVQGPFEGGRLRQLIDCEYFQMVPLTLPDSEQYELWVDEEGVYNNKQVCKLASIVFGEHVLGRLYGNVLVVRAGVID